MSHLWWFKAAYFVTLTIASWLYSRCLAFNRRWSGGPVAWMSVDHSSGHQSLKHCRKLLVLATLIQLGIQSSCWFFFATEVSTKTKLKGMWIRAMQIFNAIRSVELITELRSACYRAAYRRRVQVAEQLGTAAERNTEWFPRRMPERHSAQHHSR